MAATLTIFLNCFGAMLRIFLVSIVGVLAAKFPRDNALLTLPAIKYISRLSTFVLIPCLIINALGSALSLELLTRMAITIPFSIFTTFLSYAIGYCLKFVHEDRQDLFMASLVAASTPNSVSLPLMVMQALCEESTVNKEYDHDAEACYEEATSIMFIYSIGWHLCFWGYSYNVLNTVGGGYIPNSSAQNSHLKSFFMDSESCKLVVMQGLVWLKNVLSMPSMGAIFVGLLVGLIPPLQRMLFEDISPLRPLGGAISTLGEPVVAINCLIMAASLAHADINISELSSKYRSAATSMCRFWAGLLRTFQARPAATTSTNRGDCYRDLSDDEEDTVSQQVEEGAEYPPPESDFKEAQTNGLNQSIVPDLATTCTTESFGGSPDLPTSGRPARARSDASDWSVDGELITADMDATLDFSRTAAASTLSAISVETVDTLDRSVKGIILTGSDGADNLTTEQCDRIVLPYRRNTMSSADTTSELASALPHMRSVVFVILCRLIIPPMIIIPLIRLCVSTGVISESQRLVQLVLCIECAAPSAQMIIVSLNHLGHQHTASKMAYMFVYMYIASMITITVWGTISMITIY